MPRYFEFKDDKSSKFWEIELHGSSYTVRFGKIGTQGQTQVKDFATDAVAKKEYDKLVDEKTKKGYIEVTAGGSAPPTSNVTPITAAPSHSAKSAQKAAGPDEDDEEDEDEEEDEKAVPKSAPKRATSSGVPHAGARRFEFEDDKSSKFWEISLDGSSFTVRFGRIGTDGQEQTKDFASDEQAQKEYEKLVQEKLKKGYEEVDSDSDDLDEDDQDEGDDEPFFFEADGDGVFGGFDIEEWAGEIEDPRETAIKVALAYEDEDREGIKWGDKFGSFLEDPQSSKVRVLVVGSWGSQAMCEGTGSEELVEALVAARKQLPNLRALFIGDVESEECEISWIQQSDLSPVLEAYPNLQYLRVRGGQALELGALKHKHLQGLVLESGGLSGNLIRSIAHAQLPELVHLELWLGSDNYGADYTIEDLKPLLSGAVLPKLQYLGLRNSEMTDAIAEALSGAAILKRIKVLDLSMGTLGDSGAEALASNPEIAKLAKVNVAHHYMTEDGAGHLRPLKNVTGLDKPSEYLEEMEEDEDYRYCQVGE